MGSKHVCLLLMLLCTMSCRAQQHHGDGLDDVLQHVPMTTVLALRTCPISHRSMWPELIGTAAAAYTLSAATTWGLKHTAHELRPDHSNRRSFPSGHATFAFAGATTLRHEYGHLSPWVTVGGYAMATLISADRVRRDRHYTHDVCAGAAIGVLGTELTYYLRRHLLPHHERALSVQIDSRCVSMALCF